MLIHLDRIQEQPFEWSETVTVPADAVEAVGLLGLSEIACKGRVEKANHGYRLTARLDYEQTVACTRCLEATRQPETADIDLEIVVRPSEPTHGEVQLESDDLGVLATDEEHLDTEPILREQIQLDVPMRALCSEDCAGLCPHCGANRNETPDCCEGEGVDPRWKALEDLRGS